MARVKATGQKSAKELALERFTESFAKSYGAKTFAVAPKINPYNVIPTGSLELDFALGTGGIPLGSIFELHGSDGVGKTTLALIQAAEAQKKFPDRLIAYIDMEHKLDLGWARAMGVNLDQVFLSQPESAEVLADQIKDLITSDFASMVFLDSIGAMISEKAKEKDAGDQIVGTVPKIITRMVQIAATELRRHDAVLYMLNQARANIGANGRGPATTTGGGFARAHAALQRVAVRKAPNMAKSIGSGTQAVQACYTLVAKVEKNGAAPPGRSAEITIVTHPSAKYGMQVGIADRAGESFRVAKMAQVFTRTGAGAGIVYTFPGGRQIQGTEEVVIETLRRDPEFLDELRVHVIKAAQQTVHEPQEENLVETEDGSDDDF